MSNLFVLSDSVRRRSLQFAHHRRFVTSTYFINPNEAAFFLHLKETFKPARVSSPNVIPRRHHRHLVSHFTSSGTATSDHAASDSPGHTPPQPTSLHSRLSFGREALEQDMYARRARPRSRCGWIEELTSAWCWCGPVPRELAECLTIIDQTMLKAIPPKELVRKVTHSDALPAVKCVTVAVTALDAGLHEAGEVAQHGGHGRSLQLGLQLGGHSHCDGAEPAEASADPHPIHQRRLGTGRPPLSLPSISPMGMWLLQECRSLQNFNGSYAIVAALNNSAIARLKQTWAVPLTFRGCKHRQLVGGLTLLDPTPAGTGARPGALA